MKIRNDTAMKVRCETCMQVFSFYMDSNGCSDTFNEFFAHLESHLRFPQYA